jgi:hypothetical protein
MNFFFYLEVEFSTFPEDLILVRMHPLSTKSCGIQIGVASFLNKTSSYTLLLNVQGTCTFRIFMSHLTLEVSNQGKIIQCLVNNKVDNSGLL